MLLKRASFFLSFVDPKTFFSENINYNWKHITWNILLLPVMMLHTEEKWCTKRCVSLLVQVSVICFQTSKYLKEAQTVYNEIHRGTLF